eukprot:4573465-Amphidinium_carterae.1
MDPEAYAQKAVLVAHPFDGPFTTPGVDDSIWRLPRRGKVYVVETVGASAVSAPGRERVPFGGLRQGSEQQDDASVEPDSEDVARGIGGVLYEQFLAQRRSASPAHFHPRE